MYSKIFEGKKIRIEDEDWKKLLKRFDINEFKLSPDKTRYINTTECALCAKYNKGGNECSKCPFILFRCTDTANTRAMHGCSVVMNKLLYMLHQNYYRYIFTPIDRVHYYLSAGSTASKELKAITDFLKSFKKEK